MGEKTSFKQDLAKKLKVKKESVTDSSIFITITGILYLITAFIPFLPETIGFSIGLIYIGFWLAYPVAFYQDRKYIKKNTDWTPSRIFYLGFFPGYIGMVFIAYYLYKRIKVLQK